MDYLKLCLDHFNTISSEWEEYVYNGNLITFEHDWDDITYSVNSNNEIKLISVN